MPEKTEKEDVIFPGTSPGASPETFPQTPEENSIPQIKYFEEESEEDIQRRKDLNHLSEAEIKAVREVAQKEAQEKHRKNHPELSEEEQKKINEKLRRKTPVWKRTLRKIGDAWAWITENKNVLVLLFFGTFIFFLGWSVRGVQDESMLRLFRDTLIERAKPVFCNETGELEAIEPYSNLKIIVLKQAKEIKQQEKFDDWFLALITGFLSFIGFLGSVLIKSGKITDKLLEEMKKPHDEAGNSIESKD